MQNESCGKYNAVNSKVSEGETFTDSFISNLLDTVDETLSSITNDKTENFSSAASVSPLCKETTIGNITKDIIFSTTGSELCNFPTLTFGMEFSFTEEWFPKEMNSEECEKDQRTISEKIKISEPNASTKPKQTQKDKPEPKLTSLQPKLTSPEPKLTSYNILIDSFVNSNKRVSKENKNNSVKKQLITVINERDGMNNENTQKNDIKVSEQHKLIDSPQSIEYDKKSDNKQLKIKELEQQGLDICEETARQVPKEDEIHEHKHRQNESEGLNIKITELGANQLSQDEKEHINSSTIKKCELTFAENVQNDHLGLQCIESKHDDSISDDESKKMTEKDKNNHFETNLINYENINGQISDNHSDDEYLDIQSDECSEEQFGELPDKQSDELPEKQSDELPEKQSDEHPIKQPDEHPIKQPDEHPIKQPDEHPIKQPDEHPIEQPDQYPYKQFEEHPDKQSEEHLDKQSIDSLKKSKSTLQKRSYDSFSKQTEKDTHFKNRIMLKDEEKKSDIDENKQCGAEPERATSISKEKIQSHDDHPSIWTEKDPDTDIKKQLIKSDEIYSIESENENDQAKAKYKTLKTSDELSSKQTKYDSSISPKNKLSKLKDKYKLYSDIDEYTQSENEQAKPKIKKKLLSPDKHPRKQIEKNSNTNLDTRLTKRKEIYFGESNEHDQTKSIAENKPNNFGESNLDIVSKKQLIKSEEIYSVESEKEENDQVKSKDQTRLKSSDGSSNKQTKKISDISKKKLTKAKEIYPNESDKESNDENEQTKTKTKNKLKSYDKKFYIKQTKNDSVIIFKKQLIKSKEIYSVERRNEESEEDNHAVKSKGKKRKSADESSGKQTKKDSDIISKKKLTKVKEIYFNECEKESNDEDQQSKFKTKHKLKSSNESSRKHPKRETKGKVIELDSSESENKDSDDEDKQIKCKTKKKSKSSDELSKKLTKIDSDLTFKEKLTKSKEIDFDKNETKEFNDKDKKTKFNAKKKLKSSDESFSKLIKINSDSFTKKKLTNSNSRKNIDFDESENQVFEVDIEQENLKAKNKLNSSDGDFRQISENNSNNNSENQVVKFQAKEAFGEREIVQSDDEKEQVDSKAKKEVKIADKSSCKQPEKGCDKDENKVCENLNTHIKKHNKKINSEEKMNNKIEENVSKNSSQQKPKSKKLEGSKKQSRVPRTYKRKNKNVKENISCLSKDIHASTDNDRKGSCNKNVYEPFEIEKMYSSQIKPCKIVLERLKNLDMAITIKVPTNDTQFKVIKKQKQNMDKCIEKSTSKPEKLKGKKDMYDCNNEGTCGEIISRPDVDEAQSNDADSEVLYKPKERQLLDKQVNKIKGKQKVFEKRKNNVSNRNSNESSSESESELVADKFQLEELKQRQQPKKTVKKSNAKLEKLKKGQLKGKKNNASASNSEKVSSETYSKPVTDEVQTNSAFNELLPKTNERGLLQNQTEQSKPKLKKFDSVKLKGKKDVSVCKETFIEIVCLSDTDENSESQSEALNTSKEKLHSKELVEISDTKLEKSKGKKDGADYNNEETFCEGVSKPDTDEDQSNGGHSEVLEKPKDKYLLVKHGGKSKSVVRVLKKKLDKGKKNLSVFNSEEASDEKECELYVDKSQSDGLNQKEHSEKTVEESEAELEKSEKVKDKKDASEQNNDKTFSECVSKLDTDESQLNAGQSEALDVPKDKQFIAKRTDNFNTKLKRFHNVKIKGKNKDLPDHNSEETSRESESKPDADETRSEHLNKSKEKLHSKEFVEKSETKLEKAKGKKETSDYNNEETFCEGVSNFDATGTQSKAFQQEILDKPKEKNLKGKKKDFADDKSEETSSESECEPDSNETPSEPLKKSKQKQHTEKPLKKSEKPKGNKNASDYCNEETSSERVSIFHTDEAQSNSDQSLALDETRDKHLIGKDVKKSKLKNFDKGKQNVSVLNSEGTSDESEPEPDKSQSKKLKQKWHKKNFCKKSNGELAKLEKVQLKGNKNDATDYNIEVILNESDSKPDADEKFGKPEVKSGNDYKTVEKDSFLKSKKRKFEHVEEIESLKLKHCNVVIEECNFSNTEKTLTLDKKIPLQVRKKDSIVKEDELTDISQNADQYRSEKTASVQCEDENEVDNEIIYIVQDDDDEQADITDNIQPEDIDHSLSNCIVVVSGQNKKKASVCKDKDKEEEKISNIQSQDSKNIDNNQSDDAARVEDKCQSENAKKTTNGEQEVQAEKACNIQSQGSKIKSNAKVKTFKSSKSIDHDEESEKGNNVIGTSASNTKGKDLESVKKKQTAQCQNIEDCLTTVHGYEESQECYKKQQDSMHKSEEDLENAKSYGKGKTSSENVELEKVHVAQSKHEEVSTNQQQVNEKDKNSKLLNKNMKAAVQGINTAKSKEMLLEVFNNNLIISDEDQTGNIIDECFERHSKKISTNKLIDESNRRSIIKPCSVILEKFSSSFKGNVDEADEASRSSNYKKSSEDESKKHSRKRKRLSHVNESKIKCKTDISDEDLDSSCSDSEINFYVKDAKHSKKGRQSNILKQSSYASSLNKRRHKRVISDLEKDSDSSCNDFEGSSENEDVKDSRKKKQLNRLKPSRHAGSSNKNKYKNITSDESCSDSKESSDDEDVKGSRKQKQSNILKLSSYVSSSNKRKRKIITSNEDSSCSGSKECSDDGNKKDSIIKEQSNLLIKLSSPASSSNKRKCKNVTSVEGSSSNYSDSKKSSYEVDVKSSKKKNLSNNLKHLCLVSPLSKKKHKKDTSDFGEILDSSCSDSKESSKYMKNSKNKKHSNKLKQLIRGQSSNKKKHKNDSTSNSDEESTCCSSSEGSSEDEDLEIKRRKRSYKLKRFVRNLADDKIVRHLSCKSCKLSFKTYRHWVKHDKEFHKSFVHKCDLCYGELFKSHSSYVNHMKYFHPYEKLFFCKYRKCTKSFSSLKKFRNHHKSHYKFLCKYCKEGFMKEYQMYSHVVKYHVK